MDYNVFNNAMDQNIVLSSFVSDKAETFNIMSTAISISSGIKKLEFIKREIWLLLAAVLTSLFSGVTWWVQQLSIFCLKSQQ